MDKTALFNLSYGVYIVSTKDGSNNTGCVANSVIQVSASPATLAVSINKNNYTNSCIQSSGKIAVAVLSENVPESLIGTFGFHSGRDKEKFAGIDYLTAKSGIAIPKEAVCAYIEGNVINKADCFTHTIFIIEITDAVKLTDERPMTYDYYHKVIKGKAPKNAPTYIEDSNEGATEKKTYTCGICGYEHPGSKDEFDALPDTYICPICSAPKSSFTLQNN